MKFMIVCLLFVIVFVHLIHGNCPDDCKKPNFLYESFQCTPNCIGTDDCPISYDCSSINQHDDMCFYNGNYYKEDETVQNNVTWENCMGCTCTESADNKTDFICYYADCAPPLLIDENCVYKHSLGQCCFDGVICPPFSKCSLEGTEFLENNGKFLHPLDNCTKCTCERGNGTEGDVKCQKQYCKDLLLFQRHVRKMCAPLYYDVQYDCCPTQWICPEDNITFDNVTSNDDGPTCLFGDKTLKKKQKFYSDHDGINAVCECVLPPFATCSVVTSN